MTRETRRVPKEILRLSKAQKLDAVGLPSGPSWAFLFNFLLKTNDVVRTEDKQRATRRNLTYLVQFNFHPSSHRIEVFDLKLVVFEESEDHMDLSAVTAALESKSYEKIADICDNLMLQVGADGVAFHNDWPYAIHLLSHFYVHDINSARFLWKTIPSSIKESNPEVNAVWKIGQQLWLRNYGGVHEAIRGFEWSQGLQDFVAAFSELYTKEVFQLLVSAYSTISVEDVALFLGMSEEDASNYVLQQGWTVDYASRMLTVKKQPVVTEQKLDPRKLQQLTEYVFHLEH